MPYSIDKICVFDLVHDSRLSFNDNWSIELVECPIRSVLDLCITVDWTDNWLIESVKYLYWLKNLLCVASNTTVC